MTFPTEPQTDRTSAAADAIPTPAQSVPYPTHSDVVNRLGGKSAEEFQTTFDVPADPEQSIPLPFDPAYVMLYNPQMNTKLEIFAAMDAAIFEASGEGFLRQLRWGETALGKKAVNVDFSSETFALEGHTILVLAKGYPANGGTRMLVPD